MKKIAPAVEMKCADCNTELLVPYQLGKRKKDRRLYCGKCYKTIKGVSKENKND